MFLARFRQFFTSGSASSMRIRIHTSLTVVINYQNSPGLMRRQDAETFRRAVPVGVLPVGENNTLANR